MKTILLAVLPYIVLGGSLRNNYCEGVWISDNPSLFSMFYKAISDSRENVSMFKKDNTSKGLMEAYA